MKTQDNFFNKVYDVVMQIPEGKVATYGQIAELLGNKRMSRQVGWALHVNPKPVVVPCHRVVNREGYLAKAFAFGGISIQQQLLEQEGVEVKDGKVDLNCYLWENK